MVLHGTFRDLQKCDVYPNTYFLTIKNYNWLYGSTPKTSIINSADLILWGHHHCEDKTQWRLFGQHWLIFKKLWNDDLILEWIVNVVRSLVKKLYLKE